MPRVHYCFSQHLNEIPPPRRCAGACKKSKRRCNCVKCKCREQVSPNRARQLVELGAAEYVIIRKDLVELKKLCSMCVNDPLLKKSCSNCNKTGEVITVIMSPVRSNDIVMVTTGSGEPDHQVFRSVMSKQTPRVATIEKAHIERAYAFKGDLIQMERIEVYHEMITENLRQLIVPFVPDPWEGRAVFTFGVDNRSVGSNWGDPWCDTGGEDT